MQTTELMARARAAAAHDVVPAPDLAAWRSAFAPVDDTFATALDAGLAAGALAWCFAGGYQAALRRLVPGLAPDDFAALLVTEGRRQHPTELLTTLTPSGDGNQVLNGEKSWVAGGTAAGTLLVLAREGVEPDGRVRTALIRLSGSEVVLEPRPAAGFLDAVPHARARFAAVQVRPDRRLPGDGWQDYARPFRTLEDIHVSTAIAAHLLAEVLRRAGPDPLVAVLLSCLDRLGYLATLPPDAPATHLLLAGAEQELAQVAARLSEWLRDADSGFARDWRANGMLLGLAAPARARRLQKAVAALRPAQ